MNNMKNSKFSFTKNFLYFLIAPALILLVGIILLSTVGFNLGTDFRGGVSFRVYANYENVIETSDDIKSYDLNDKNDFNEVVDKINYVLNSNGLKAVSIRKTTMNIAEYDVYNGQAVEVVYQNNGKALLEVRDQVIDEFGYVGKDEAVTTFDTIQSSYTFNYVVALVAAIVFGIITLMLYLGFRFDKSAFLVSIMQVALDIFLVLGALLITRVTINLTFAVTLLTTLLLTAVNLIYFYTTMKSAIKQGKFEKVKPVEMADTMTRECLMKKIVVLFALLAVFVLLAALVPGGVREVSLGIIIALIVTFYSSECIMPSLWATINSVKKKKKYGYQQKDVAK